MSDKEKLLQLMTQKDEIEKQILEKEIIINDLQKNKQLDKNLIDEEGFPRADLEFGELANFRDLKRNIRELKNDHMQLMKEIEQGLYQLHDIYSNSPEVQQEIQQYEATHQQQQKNKQTQNTQTPITEEEKKEILMPFAEINEVTLESPSYTAGIKVKDLIVQFGTINYYNNDNLQKLAEFVKSKENCSLEVILLRNSENDKSDDLYEYKGKKYQKISLILCPQKWNGIGLLGCRFKPITK